jgi:hypothetical protein
MPSRVRFPAARDVFETFPDLKELLPPPADDTPPLEFARRLLASRRPSQSILFLAHLLPRREAVWWARQCVCAILGTSAQDEALRAAEAWVRAPEEPNRRAALDLGKAANRRSPSTWLALAAGSSGGSRSAPEQKPTPPQPSACARAANAAIILAISAQGAGAVSPWIRACAEAGLRFAEGGDASVAAPVVGRSGAA